MYHYGLFSFVAIVLYLLLFYTSKENKRVNFVNIRPKKKKSVTTPLFYELYLPDFAP